MTSAPCSQLDPATLPGADVRALPTRRSLIGALACATLLPARLAAAPIGDIAILRDACTALHPGLYRYASPVTVAARLTALERVWHRTDDLAARYLALSRFTATIRCGHTYPNFYNQKKAVAAQLFGWRNRLPFTFRWIAGRMIVTGGADLPRGAEIVRIDGRTARDILAALLPLMRADGGNDDKRRALLDVAGADEYESFDIYYPLVFPAGDRFALEVRLPDGRKRAQTVAAIDLAGRRAGRPDRGETFGWTLGHRGDASIVTMPDWSVYDSDWDWKGWIDASMNAIARRGSARLVIDLRENEGGLDCGDEIIAHLIDGDLVEPGHDRRVRFRRAPEALLPYLDTWDQSFRTLGVDSQDRSDGFYTLPGTADTVIKPRGPRFRGQVFVLVGPQNSSATFQFAARIRAQRLGTLVGAPTGGNRSGINGGSFFFLRLPGGLEVDLPLIGYFPRTPQPDAGLVPDIVVATSAADIAAGRDAAMARALA